MLNRSSIRSSLFVAAVVAIGLISSIAWAITGTWNTTSGDWGLNTNWSSNPNIPNAVGDTAVFQAANPTGFVVTLDGTHVIAPTVGTMILNSRASSGTGWTISGTGPLTLNNGASSPLISINNPVPSDTIFINAPLAGAGFTLAGTGTLSIGAQHASLLTGPTILNPSLNNSAILNYAVDNANVGLLQFGVITSASNINTATTTSGSVNVNGNVTMTGIVAQTNSGNAGAPGSSDIVNIATGKTLALNAAADGASLITVGYDTGSSGSATPQTDLVFTGDTLNLSRNGHTGVLLTIGPSNSGTANVAAEMDMYRLKNFTFDGGSTGEVRVGGGTGAATGNRVAGILNLANTTNTITAGTVTVGGGSTGTGGTTSVINLGAGTNIFNVDNLNIGDTKSNGQMGWPTQQTQLATGSLTLRASDGVSAVNTIAIGRTTTGGAVISGTLGGGGNTSLNGHNVDILANTLILGNKVLNTTVDQAQNTTGIFSFDTGTVSVNSVIMATRNNTNATPGSTGSATGTLTVNGGTFTVGAGGFTIADNPLGAGGSGSSTQLAAGTVNIGGGALSTGSDILVGATTPANTQVSGVTQTPFDKYTATINLQGGTLNMNGHNIGSATLPITGAAAGTAGFVVTAGTLQDVGAINTTNAVNTTLGVAVTNGIFKTGAGTFTLAGTNNYTGDTVIGTTGATGGVVVVTGTTNQGNVTVNQGALSGSGGGGVGNVTLNVLDSNNSLTASSIIDPGPSSAGGVIGLDGQYGTLTVKSLTAQGTGGIMRFDLTDTTGGPNDNISVTNASGASFAQPTKVSLAAIPAPGNYNLVTLTGGGSFNAGDISNISLLTAGSTRPGLFAASPLTFVGTSLQLHVTGTVGNLSWTGQGNGTNADGLTWDVANNRNWSGATDGDNRFYNFDSATFGNTTGNRNVNLTAQIQPKLVTFNNSTGNDYILSGTGGAIIGAGNALTKTGTGNVLINTANSYTGATTISQGKLILSATGGIASTSRITIAPGATLQFGNGDFASNSGTNSTTNIALGMGSAPITDNGTLIFSTASTVVGGNGFVSITNVISGSGNIQINGTGNVRLSGANTNFLGPITVNSGIFSVGNVAGAGPLSNTSPITVLPGAAFDLTGAGNNLLVLGARQVSFAGTGPALLGSIFTSAVTQQQSAIKNATMTNDSWVAGGRVDFKGGTLDLGGHTISIIAGSQVVFNAENVTDGNVVINAGGVLNLENAIVNGNGSISGNGTALVIGGTGNATIMRLTGAGPGSITRPIIINGPTQIAANFDTTGNPVPLISTNLPITIDSPITLKSTLVMQTSLAANTNSVITLNGNITEDSVPRSIIFSPNGTSTNNTTVILAAANSFTGGITFHAQASTSGQGVIVQLGEAGSLNSSGANTVNFTANGNQSGFGLRLNGFDASVAGLTSPSLLVQSSQNEFVENASFNPVTLTVNNSVNNQFNGIIRDGVSLSGTGNATLTLIKNGAGALALGGANTYTGNTTVNNGTLSITGSLTGPVAGSTLTVNSGASLTGTGSLTNVNVSLNSASSVISAGASPLTGGTLTLSNLTVGSGGAKILYDVGIGDNINVTNGSGIATFASGGTTTIVPAFSAPPSTGTYNVVSATALTTTGHTFAVSVPSNTRSTFAVVNDGSNHVQLQVNGNSGKSLVWAGGGGTDVWDVGGSGTQNWSDDGGTTRNEKFFNLDQVRFDDSTLSTGHHTVSLAAGTTLQPVSINVDSTATYTFNGSGNIGGTASLTKNNNGTLILANTTANTYTGGTTINSGTLQLGSAGALPANSTLTINSGTLDLGGNTASITSLSGSGTINSSSAGGTVTITGDGNSSFFGNIQNGAGSVALNVASGAVLTLSGSQNTYTGATTVSGGGTLQAGTGTTNAFSSGSTITLGSGATSGTLDLNGTSVVIGGLLTSGTGNANVVGNSSGTASTLTIASAGNITFGGIIRNFIGVGTGAVSLKIGGGDIAPGTGAMGTVTLSGVNAYTGTTTVNGNATLQLGSSTALPNGAVVLGESSNNTNGTLDLNGFSPTISSLAIQGTGTGNTIGNSSATPSTLIYAGPTAASTYAGNIQNVLGSGTSTVGLNVFSGTLNLSGTNTYSGSTVVQNGATLTRSASAGISPNSVVTLGAVGIGGSLTGGTLNISGGNVTLPGLLSAGLPAADIVTNNGGTDATLTLALPGSNNFGGIIRDGTTNKTALSVTSGSLTLSGASTYSGNTTVGSGATLTLGANYAIGATAAPAIASKLVLSGGSPTAALATGGNSNTFGQLAMSASSTIDLGNGNSTLRFANSNSNNTGNTNPNLPAAWTGQLNITNWTYGSDHMYFGYGQLADNFGVPGLDPATQLSVIKINNFVTGASINTLTGELTPRIGDVDQNGVVNSLDLATLEHALTDFAFYQGLTPQLTDTDRQFLLDVNHDGVDTNADIQGEIYVLINGTPPPGPLPGASPVPEPSSILMLALGSLVLLRHRARRETGRA